MEILDEEFNPKPAKRLAKVKLLCLIIGAIISILLIEENRSLFSYIRIPNNPNELSIAGLFILVVFISLLNLSSKYINEIKPDWNIFKVAIGVGVILFLVEFTFKSIQQVLRYSMLNHNDILEFLGQGSVFGVIGFVYSNYYIRKIRNKKYGPALFIFIVFFAAIIYLFSEVKIVK